MFLRPAFKVGDFLDEVGGSGDFYFRVLFGYFGVPSRAFLARPGQYAAGVGRRQRRRGREQANRSRMPLVP
jgi:hypothetical protein